MLDSVPLSWYLILSAILFALGIAGFLFRRNIITVFMSIELMLNAVNLTFVTFSYKLKQVDGHIFSFFVMVVAAAEAAVGLAIILTVFKNRQTLEDRRSRFDEDTNDATSGSYPIFPLAGFADQRHLRPALVEAGHQCCRHRLRAAVLCLGPEDARSACGRWSTAYIEHYFTWIQSGNSATSAVDFAGRPPHRRHAAGGHRRRLC